MKKALFIFLAGVIAAIAQSAPSGKVTLAWTYDTNLVTSDTVFVLYHSLNPSAPLTNWTPRATIPGTNRLYSITVNPGVNYFYLASSNFWGLSPPSNVAATPPLPELPQNVSLSRTN